MNIFFILSLFLLETGAGSACYVNCFSEKMATINAEVIMSLLKKHQEQHQEMIKEIEREIEATVSYTGVDHLSPKVLKALEQVPRHLFVSPDAEPLAYLNRALPIGEGQTISQPFIVALMTEILDIQPTDIVLEIGTGSGYQSAILAHLAKEVYSIKVVPSHVQAAQKRLDELGYKNIHVLKGNGAKG